MKEAGCEAILLMGDTPYIDSYDLATVRQRHREFLHIPELRPLLASLPVWGTWDDHDFGLNAHLGNSDPAGKQRTRRAFTEYRALENFGEQNEGIYTRFRSGPIEVWLLDPRWFSRIGPSPVDAAKPTCFGPRQWDWLLKTLRASTAPFKLLAMGLNTSRALEEAVGSLPQGRGKLVLTFASQDGVSAARLAVAAPAGDPLSPKALAVLLDGATITATWQPGLAP